MKHIYALIMVLLSLPMGSIAQEREIREKPPGAIYLAFQPVDLGIGLRGDVHFYPQFGMYGSASYGEWSMYKASGLGQHVKLTGGLLLPLGHDNDCDFDLTVGYNYHWVSGEIIPSEYFEPHSAFETPSSFEVGLTVKMSRMALAFSMDFRRMESCLYIGITL